MSDEAGCSAPPRTVTLLRQGFEGQALRERAVLPLLLAVVCLTFASCTTGKKVVVLPDHGADRQDLTEILTDLRPATELPGNETAVPELPTYDIASDLETQDFDSTVPPDTVHPPCSLPEDCDDGNECTWDDCVDTACVHLPMPGAQCCDNDGDCNDSIECTNDFCAGGKCLHTKKSNLCCVDVLDCDDSNACTQDLCAGNTCGHVLLRSYSCACGSFLECQDGLACTSEVCDSGQCVYTPQESPGCCLADNQCDDNDPATWDRCLQHTCSHITLAPCFLDEHCAVPDPCITAKCVDNKCDMTAVPGCCTVDGQCEDGQALTFNLCIDNVCRTSLTASPAVCASVEECKDNTDCTVEECVSGLCFVTVDDGAGCCFSDEECDDFDPCTADSCSALACKHEPVQETVAHVIWSFDTSELDGFEVETDGSNIFWQASVKGFISAPYSLYFGDPAGPTINNGKHVSGTALSPAATLPTAGPATLKAWTFVDVEPLYSMDLLTLSAVYSDKVQVIWSKEDINGSTAGAWKEVEVPLPPALLGQSVRFLFSFDSVDNKNNDYQGVYFDDVRLMWPCQ